jgi:hypothetical protein
MATHIKNLIQEFLKDTKNRIDDKQRVLKIIDENLDRKLKKHVWLERIEKDKIIFNSESSNFSYVFNLKKDALLKEIQKELPQIKSLKIKISADHG